MSLGTKHQQLAREKYNRRRTNSRSVYRSLGRKITNPREAAMLKEKDTIRRSNLRKVRATRTMLQNERIKEKARNAGIGDANPNNFRKLRNQVESRNAREARFEITTGQTHPAESRRLKTESDNYKKLNKTHRIAFKHNYSGMGKETYRELEKELGTRGAEKYLNKKKIIPRANWRRALRKNVN